MFWWYRRFNTNARWTWGSHCIFKSLSVYNDEKLRCWWIEICYHQIFGSLWLSRIGRRTEFLLQIMLQARCRCKLCSFLFDSRYNVKHQDRRAVVKFWQICWQIYREKVCRGCVVGVCRRRSKPLWHTSLTIPYSSVKYSPTRICFASLQWNSRYNTRTGHQACFA